MNVTPDLPACSPLRLGEEAPDFTARSTRGVVSLSDYRGRWLALFSHPADFTPVCTSEFVAIARASDRFSAMGCELMAVSVDSLFSHLAWIRAIKDRFDVTVEFPIIEDPTLQIARAYGMVGANAVDASAVRATYFLDPEGILRASTWYPLSVGRSVEEMLRLVAALQRVHDGTTLAPEGWRPGDDLLAVPSQDIDDVLAAPDGTDWFYTLVRDPR
ncbi:peroxiredoxin [Tardibacter chloracetimidivorans]|uniref:Thioredoxin peroxidase n=1 Tax=Tardibacter chloracetimidivorans TaxID=1921510 RepID=A0A1L3ZVY8_9SPHN|nr:peroxiredoxin [Tardibacter chloracetimidivorans]